MGRQQQQNLPTVNKVPSCLPSLLPEWNAILMTRPKCNGLSTQFIGLIPLCFLNFQCNVSLHSVKASTQTCKLFNHMAAAHGTIWFTTSVDVHSCTLSLEVWHSIEVREFHLQLHHLLHSLPIDRGEGRNIYP